MKISRPEAKIIADVRTELDSIALEMLAEQSSVDVTTRGARLQKLAEQLQKIYIPPDYLPEPKRK